MLRLIADSFYDIPVEVEVGEGRERANGVVHLAEVVLAEVQRRQIRQVSYKHKYFGKF